MSVPETPINGTTPAGGTPRPELNIAEEPIPSAVESDTNTALKSAALISNQELQATPALLAPSLGREEAEDSVKNSPDASKPDVKQSPESRDGPESATAVSVEPSLEKVVPDSAKKPEPPVTHTGPEAESLPAPAPAPTEASAALASAESVPDGDVKTGTKRKLSDVASLAVAKQPKLDPVSAKPGSANGLGDPAVFEPSLNSPQAAQPKSPSKKVPNGKRGKKAPVVGRTARKTRSQGPADL
ncbi:hypothetical protein AAL_02411 [Moelleriella libera RCEF 2490]|uniref:Uncharacterized protein n=1 Tax=Moelleriella libera RCEF 2490 TaxID=1081109 RepID=A0A166PT43_9HYPO|nr:hypothetical protein AAL_02411 [Moelleriella libera RCEF 2490]